MENYTVFGDSSVLYSSFAQYLLSCAEKSIESHGTFILGVSGGSLAAILGELSFDGLHAQFEKWHLFLVDERAVPITHSDSNYNAIIKAWPSSVLCKWHFIDFPAGLNEDADLTQFANQYSTALSSVFSTSSVACFDLLLLGLGPDGHTASLFLNHADFLKNLNNETDYYIPVYDSPKPPPLRVSLSPKTIMSARKTAFVITKSASKAPIISAILKDPSCQYPPKIVAPDAEWFIDEASGVDLK